MARRFRNCSGPQIRAGRIAKGLTQEQLAARLQLAGLHNIDRLGVAKIESQLRSVFDFELPVIAAELGVEPSMLLPPIRKLKSDLDDLIAGER
ncbi:MAG: helix-turn-helix domain-containing protein [Verrucomicrobiales bacterium]